MGRSSDTYLEVTEVFKQPTELTLTVTPLSVEIGQSVDISIRLTSLGVPVPGKGGDPNHITVWLRRPDGTLASLTSWAGTDANGQLSWIFTPDMVGAWTIWAEWAGDVDYEGCEENRTMQINSPLLKIVALGLLFLMLRMG